MAYPIALNRPEKTERVPTWSFGTALRMVAEGRSALRVSGGRDHGGGQTSLGLLLPKPCVRGFVPLRSTQASGPA
jgi:hypothetical protein